MLYKLLLPLSENISLFTYITFRAAMAAISSLLFSFFVGKYIIRLIKKMNIREKIRTDGPDSHKKKANTPTMGGIIIILSILIGILLWADLSNSFIVLLTLITIILGILGFIDDMLKQNNKNGIIPIYKLFVQISIGIIVALFVLKNPVYFGYETMTNVILLKNIMINLSIFFIPFVILVLVGTSNAVNLSDGLDGLAAGMLGIIFTVFLIIAYVSGNAVFSNYLNMKFIPGSGEITVFLAAAAASCLGFLWYNTNPAEIFMGDIGSLTLGGILGTSAILLKQEILLLIAGGVFAIETLSVIIQVTVFKITGKRVFPMAPLHHSFELKGMPENRIVVRFWIVSILFGILAISTLKLR